MAPPPPIIPPAPLPTKSLEDRIASELSDIYFDYDKSDIRGDTMRRWRKTPGAESDSRGLSGRSHRFEGHCDERGSAEYNLGSARGEPFRTWIPRGARGAYRPA